MYCVHYGRHAPLRWSHDTANHTSNLLCRIPYTMYTYTHARTRRKTATPIYTLYTRDFPNLKMATADTEADYHLVEESQERSFDCPVCLQVLNDPCTSECCRKNFCRACVIKIRGNNNPCPMCRHPEFKTRNNGTLSREVYQLQVYCGNQSKGCEWKGCLGEAETHLNKRPVTRYLTSGCQYVDIECMFCSKPYQRCQIGDHCDNECPQRPFSCEYCNKYDTHYEDVSKYHWPVCRFYPVLCRNKCGKYIPRKSLKDHIAKDCSMTIVECEFKQFGCKEHLTRKEMSVHMKYSATAHESLKMMSTLVRQMEKQEKEIHELETKLSENNKKVLKEQKILFEQSLTSAMGKMNNVLKSVREKSQQLETLERRFNKRITQDNDANRRLVSLCERFEHRLHSREEYDEFIRFQIFGQGAIFHKRLVDLEEPLYQRVYRKVRQFDLFDALNPVNVLIITFVVAIMIFYISVVVIGHYFKK